MDEVTTPVAPSVELPSYKDDDLVYVDPKKRVVVAIVEFSKAGNPKPLAMQEEVVEDDEEVKDPKDTKGKLRPRIRRTRYYPWGTYRSMKKVYKLEGKVPREENQKTLDDVIEKALKEPFWD